MDGLSFPDTATTVGPRIRSAIKFSGANLYALQPCEAVYAKRAGATSLLNGKAVYYVERFANAMLSECVRYQSNLRC